MENPTQYFFCRCYTQHILSLDFCTGMFWTSSLISHLCKGLGTLLKKKLFMWNEGIGKRLRKTQETYITNIVFLISNKTDNRGMLKISSLNNNSKIKLLKK